MGPSMVMNFVVYGEVAYSYLLQEETWDAVAVERLMSFLVDPK